LFLPEFKLERYFARYEFTAERLLCCSDIQGWSMADVLALADEECRALWQGLTLGYTESTGHPLLRREIARLYGLEAEDILTFAGAEEAILAALSALLGPGDHALGPATSRCTKWHGPREPRWSGWSCASKRVGACRRRA